MIMMEFTFTECGKDNYFRELDACGDLQVLFPEVTLLKGLHQNPAGHTTDAFTHTLLVIDNLPNDPIYRLAGLLHDIGKAETTDAEGHAYDHDKIGAEIAENILNRLIIVPSECKKLIYEIVLNHMKIPNFVKSEPNEKAMRRFWRNYGKLIPTLFHFTIADTMSDHPDRENEVKRIQLWYRKMLQVKDETEIQQNTKEDLAINGYDLMNMGFEGKQIGIVKAYLTDKIKKGHPNSRSSLLNLLELLNPAELQTILKK